MEKPTFTHAISLIMVLLTFAVIFLLFFVEVPEANKENINTIVGFLMGTCMSGVVGYFLGSSQGSEKKTDIIKSMSENNTAP